MVQPQQDSLKVNALDTVQPQQDLNVLDMVQPQPDSLKIKVIDMIQPQQDPLKVNMLDVVQPPDSLKVKVTDMIQPQQDPLKVSVTEMIRSEQDQICDLCGRSGHHVDHCDAVTHVDGFDIRAAPKPTSVGFGEHLTNLVGGVIRIFGLAVNSMFATSPTVSTQTI